jgi:MoxR-like ATPase
VDRITSEHKRLRLQEKEAEEQLAEYQRKATEALSRLSRIRSQRESLVTRGAEMVNRGLKSLDELDEAERAESEAVIGVQLIGGVDVIDWNAVLSDFGPLIPQNGETSLSAPES